MLQFLCSRAAGTFSYYGHTYALAPLTPPEINPSHILVASSGLERAILDEHPNVMQPVSFAAERIPSFPKPLSGRPEELPPGSRILLLRAGGIGDLIMLPPALKIQRERLAGRAEIILATYSDYAGIFEGLVDKILPYPVTLGQLLCEADFYLEFNDPKGLFASGEMADYYLDHLSIAPESVAASDKKPILPQALAQSPAVLAQLERLAARPRILFAGSASDKIRRLPERILAELAAAHPNLSFVVPGPSAVELANVFSLDTSGGLGDFVTAIRHCDALVSADSAAYHIAAAFDIPALVLFGPIGSSIRTGYYPRVIALDAGYRGQTCESPCGISTILRRTKLKQPIGTNQVTLLERGTAIVTNEGQTIFYDPDRGCPEAIALDSSLSPCLRSIRSEAILKSFKGLLTLIT